jgi:hypothetical protein
LEFIEGGYTCDVTSKAFQAWSVLLTAPSRWRD